MNQPDKKHLMDEVARLKEELEQYYEQIYNYHAMADHLVRKVVVLKVELISAEEKLKNMESE